MALFEAFPRSWSSFPKGQQKHAWEAQKQNTFKPTPQSNHKVVAGLPYNANTGGSSTAMRSDRPRSPAARSRNLARRSPDEFLQLPPEGTTQDDPTLQQSGASHVSDSPTPRPRLCLYITKIIPQNYALRSSGISLQPCIIELTRTLHMKETIASTKQISSCTANVRHLLSIPQVIAKLPYKSVIKNLSQTSN